MHSEATYFFGFDGGRLMVSTTAPFLLPCADFTVVKRPVPALRPIFIVRTPFG